MLHKGELFTVCCICWSGLWNSSQPFEADWRWSNLINSRSCADRCGTLSANKFLNRTTNAVQLPCLPKWTHRIVSRSQALFGIWNSNLACALGFPAANSKGRKRFHMQNPHLKPAAATLFAPVVISGSSTAVCQADRLHHSVCVEA